MLLTAADNLGAAVALMEELSALARAGRGPAGAGGKDGGPVHPHTSRRRCARASGEGGLAAFVETAGTILALGAALPLARAVTSLLAEMLT